MRKIGKQGKGNGMVVGFILLAVLIVGVGGFAVMNSISGGNGEIPTAGCNIAPSISVLATDALAPGTTPTVSANYSIYDGQYVGGIPSSPAAGKSLDVLATATNYMNSESKIEKIACDGNDLKFSFVPYAAPSYTILDANFNTLTDGATGAVNETASANQIIDTLKISGTPLKTTGDMLVVIEYTNKTEVSSSSINLAGATRVKTPTWYTVSATTSAVQAFTVPAIVDGGSKSYDLTLSPESGQTIGAVPSSVYTTIYVLEPVVLDTNSGKFLTESTWEDSLGADKTKANVDYDFAID